MKKSPIEEVKIINKETITQKLNFRDQHTNVFARTKKYRLFSQKT